MRRVCTRLILAAALFLPATGASAADVQCGDTLVADTVLQADLGPCPSFGLRIVADGVVLDLNGHRLLGPPGKDSQYGLVIGGSGVTVRNGTVAEFGNGMLMAGSRNTVTGMTIKDNIGPDLGVGTGAGVGIQLSFADDNVIRGNRILHNGPVAGIRLFASNRNTIDGNVVAGNDIARIGFGSHGERLGQSDVGIAIHAQTPRILAAGNMVTANLVSANGSHGIQLAPGADDTVVERNNVTGNGVGQIPGFPDADGVWIGSNRNRVAANSATFNSGNGIAIHPTLVRTSAGTLVLTDGDNNRVTGNRSVFNGRGPSTAFDLRDGSVGCAANVWSGNQFLTANQPCVRG